MYRARRKLYKLADIFGLNDKRTLRASRKLDKIVLQKQKALMSCNSISA